MPRSPKDFFDYSDYETPKEDMDEDIFTDPWDMRGSVDLTLHYVTREEWGALPRKGFHTTSHPFNLLVDHFTYTDRCHTLAECTAAMKELQLDHMSHGLTDIKYNILIGGDGSIFEGRGWHYTASQSLKELPSRLRKRLHIAFIGDYSDEIPYLLLLRRKEIVDFMRYHRMLYKGYFATKSLRRPANSLRPRAGTLNKEPSDVNENKVLTPEEIFKIKQNKIYATYTCSFSQSESCFFGIQVKVKVLNNYTSLSFPYN